jgi:GT2 family glycosyltransferase
VVTVVGAAPTRSQQAISPAPTCTVVVCAYTEQRWDDIARGVSALARQTQPATQLVMVVDHNPQLLARATGAFAPEVQVLANRHGKGLSGARNTGVEAATGEVVAFLDDDAEPADDWLERQLAPYADPDVMGVGGAALPAWEQERPRWLPPELDWVVGCSYRGLPDKPAQVRNPIGANMSFRRTAFAGGGFTEGLGRVGTLPLGCEETEFSIRAVAAHPGSRVMYAPGSVVHHHVTPDRTTWRYLVRRCYAEGQSKAAVASLVGTGPALASERAYLRSTLPRALRRELGSAAGGRRRAGAVVVAVAGAGAGYARQRCRRGAR